MQHACLGARAVMMGPGPRIYALISDIRLTMDVSGSKNICVYKNNARINIIDFGCQHCCVYIQFLLEDNDIIFCCLWYSIVPHLVYSSISGNCPLATIYHVGAITIILLLLLSTILINTHLYYYYSNILILNVLVLHPASNSTCTCAV